MQCPEQSLTKKRIVCLDGGGTKGYFTMHVLQHMTDIHDKIDLLVGVSIGAIIGALVAINKLDIDVDSLAEYIDTIFTKHQPDDQTTRPLIKPQFDGVSKTKVLQTLFGDRTLGSVTIPLAILVDTVRTCGTEPMIFKSWDENHATLSLVQLLDATSAVPVQFPTVAIDGIHYLDGGVVSSSPVCISYFVGAELFHTDTIHILSIGTHPPDASCNDTRGSITNMGLLHFLSAGYHKHLHERCSILMNRLVGNFLGPGRYLRISCAMTAAIDDVTIDQQCRHLADVMWEQHREDIHTFMN